MSTRCERHGQTEIGIISHEGREFAALGATVHCRGVTAYTKLVGGDIVLTTWCGKIMLACRNEVVREHRDGSLILLYRLTNGRFIVGYALAESGMLFRGELVFAAFHRALRPGGSVWVFDLVQSSIPAVGQVMRRRYGEYLTRLKDEAYRDHVFAYVEKEDTPRPLLFQLDLLRHVGFSQVEILHKNVCFAAFGAVKAG
jgi:hypothetical protein